jgi:DNA-binding IclR family transcriptional regulator
LEAEGLVARGEDRRYRLGRQALYLGSSFARGILEQPGLVAELDELHARTRETSYLGSWNDEAVVVLMVRPGLVPVMVGGLGVGDRQDAHGATAKALLASARPEQLERYLRRRPVLDREAFEAELQIARNRGFALDDGKFAEGVTCVSAPVLTAENRTIAALSVAVPADRFRKQADTLVQEVADAGRRASANLGYVLAS